MTPPAAELPRPKPHLHLMDLLVLALSVYVLAALVVEILVPLSPEVRRMMQIVDWFVCGVFFIDFLLRLKRAPSRRAFMKWGWIDLLACVPVVEEFRSLGLLRLVRVVRILRAFRSARALVAFLCHRKPHGLATTAVLASLVVLIFSCIAVLAFEDDPQSNIRTPLDAVWWAFTTMTTVGYGDRYPVTSEGRVVAILLMVTGVGLFSVLTGSLARYFIEPEEVKEQADLSALIEEVRRLRAAVDQLNGIHPPPPHPSAERDDPP